MAEYLPLHQPGKSFTRQASAAILAGQLLVVTGSGTVGPASAATAAFVGVAAFDAASGDNVTVYAGGIQRLVASGTVTAAQTVEAAASGTVATHTNGANDVNIVGLALTTATAVPARGAVPLG
jgi:predicted RecA/RadA family phage recombinase